jgi:O-antigen/teichoic acid export membrane protein
VTPNTRGGGFSERVAIVFVAQVMTAGIGIFNAFLFARLLGPAVKGDYYLLVMLPATGMVLVQLGLPSALAFFAARHRTVGMMRKTVLLTVVLSAVAVLVGAPLLPLLEDGLLQSMDPALVVATACVLPVLLLRTLSSSILIALKAVRWFAVVMLAEAIANTVLLIFLVGVLGLGLVGAVAMYATSSILGMTGLWIGARRVVAATPPAGGVGYRELLRYGLPLYLGSLTSFFSNRADVFLIAALATDASASLGYYSMAVTLAEMATYLPGAVASIFLPHVAGAQRSDADRDVTTVSRATLLLTGASALLLAPAGTILISVLLPAFTPALPALYVLLPAVVSLAVMRVVGEYVSGLGLTGRTSVATVLGFGINLVANVILIPRFGIVGAAAASLISYTASALAITLIASRLSSAPLARFWVPRPADARFIWTTGRDLVRQVMRRRRAGGSRNGDAGA